MAEQHGNKATGTKDVVANVQELLKTLSQQHTIDPLKKLFWSELNYDRADETLSRSNWPESTARLLTENPVLLATGYGDFPIIYSRLASDQLSTGSERLVVTQLMNKYLDGLFIFSDQSQRVWHFVNVKDDNKNAKRRLFRRITVGPEERLRTAAERLAMLDLAPIHPESRLEVVAQHDKAFDVEAVTRKFFEQYRLIFERVERLIQGFTEPEQKRLFTQRLFNRLMFIAFVQKKGWLEFGGRKDYLSALWNAYKRENADDKNFYSDRLKLLFFTGLNTAHEIDVIGINRGGFLKTLIGDVPYLNGGLFEENEDDRNLDILVPDECLDAILHELFDRFNFTVTESTPLDIEVAVDPEMLGKVFEELVTGRHETGSYYTPKPVVSFMCREALKGYLITLLSAEPSTAIDQFVDEHNPLNLRNPEATLDALRKVKVCDPACGSGAYLLGMLHELLDLRSCLFAAKHLDHITVYQRKLEIIQSNVYGVDLDPFAINIARLRMWLSLIVDFEGQTPPQLPNLDFKIEEGDSLIAPNPETLKQRAFRDELLSQYLEAKARFMTSHGGEKLSLKEKISQFRADIASWTHQGSQINGFDWPVEFAEVFSSGGFDIVLANPPYVRADAQFKHLRNHEDARQIAIAQWKSWRESLLKSKIYQTLYEKWDLYLPFLERAYQLLRKNGHMVFIIPDAYNAAKYTLKSHEYFLQYATIERIDFCSDIPLFDAGVKNTILQFSKASCDITHQPIRIKRRGDRPDDFNTNIEPLPTGSQQKFGIALFKPNGTPTTETMSGFIELGKICYISKGMVINSDEDGHFEIFTADDVLSETKDKNHLKRFVLGKDVDKWRLRKVRYLEWGTERAPNQFSRPTFAQLHETKEKLIAVRTPGAIPKVIYDNDQLHFDASSVGFIQWDALKGVRNKSIQKLAKYRDEIKKNEIQPDVFREDFEYLSQQFIPKYLLAVMNSTFAQKWLATKRRSNLHIYPDDWKSLPIPPATAMEQERVVALVNELLAIYTHYGSQLPPEADRQVAELESKINEQVDELYKKYSANVNEILIER